MKLNKKLLNYCIIILFSLVCLFFDIITVKNQDRLFTLFDEKTEEFEPVIEEKTEPTEE